MNAKIIKIVSALGIITILLGVTGAPLAAAKVEREIIYWDYHYSSPCGGEIIRWAGFYHASYHTTVDGQGDTHFQVHFRYHLTGIGEESGIKYESIWNQNISRQFKGPGPWEYKTIDTYRITAEGKGKAWVLKIIWVTTIYPSGEWDFYQKDYRWYCE